MFARHVWLFATFAHLGLLAVSSVAQTPIGSGFVYQGQLKQLGTAVSDNADFKFSLWDAESVGGQIGSTLTASNVAVADGLFSVELNFGSSAFTGDARWLEIAVRTPHDPSDTAPFTTLTPRQPLTAAPFAAYALNAGQWQTSGSAIVNTNSGFVGINRDYTVGSEWFGVHAPVNSGYGGMYVTTEGATAWPFYGYHTGTEKGWHYLDGSDGDWHLDLDGIRLTVTDEGNVGIGTSSPSQRLHVRSFSEKAIFAEATHPSDATVGVHGTSASNNGFAYGVFGELTNPSSTGSAVYGRAPFYGVTGEATGAGVGVIGRSSLGVYGETSSTTGTGVMGASNATSGTNYGVYGIANSNAGYGGYFAGRGYFENDLGVGTTPTFRLDVREASTSANIGHLERVADAASGADLLELEMGAASDANSQYIECQTSGNDIKFRVFADGDVSADGVFTPGGADYAEMVRISSGADSVEAGDVMVIDPANPRAFLKSTTARSTLVAGIHSTRPGVLGSEHDWDQLAGQLATPNEENPDEGPAVKSLDLGRMIDEIPLAVIGIVPVKVSAENGAIRPGDLLVTSDTAGHAMRDDDPRAGTIVGKALGTQEKGTGVIKVLVTLQ